jgi:hypothetical protein
MSLTKPFVPTDYRGRKRLGKIIFSIFCFLIVTVSLVFFILSIFRPYTGLSLSKTDSGWQISYVDPNSLAAQANIKVGDRPVEINGQSSQIFLKQYEKAGLVMSYSIKQITVIDNNGQLKSLDTGNARLPWKSRINPIIWFILSLSFWIDGIWVYFRKPENLASILFCLCGLVLGLALSGNIAGARSIPGGSQTALIFTTIGPWMLLHFFVILPEERAWIQRKPYLYLIYLPVLIILILLPTIGYSNGQPVSWFRMVRFFSIAAGFLAILGVAIYNYVSTSSVRTRQQMKIILYSCLLSLTPILCLSYLPMLIWRQSVLDSTYRFYF